MSKKQAFIDYVSPLFAEGNIPSDVMDYWNAFTAERNTEKPAFTENGMLVFKFLKEHMDIETWKSKDIADAIGLSSRSVSGSCRKLVTDGYVDKLGKDPIFYTLTEKGKEYKIEE